MPPPLAGSEPEFEPLPPVGLEPDPESPPPDELGSELEPDPPPGVQVGTLLVKKPVESGPPLDVLLGTDEFDVPDGALVREPEVLPEPEPPELESTPPRF